MNHLKKYWKKFSYTGLSVAVVFFAASLTPSLLPRPIILQGLLSGLALAGGYGAGCLLAWLWSYLEIPVIKKTHLKIYQKTLAVFGLFVLVYSLGRSVVWQNSIREPMGMELINRTNPILILLVALLLFIVIIFISRVLRNFFYYLTEKLDKVIPLRVSRMIGFLLVALFFIFLISDVLGGWIIDSVDSSSKKIDQIIDENINKPVHFLKTGSEHSLVEWESVGRMGKEFVVNGPDQGGIANFWGEEVKEPIRVYVGLRTRETAHERAQLALEELKRVGAFEREILLIASPTGTGWLDPNSVNSFEYIHRGDTAIVAVQYSYLSSGMSVLVAPEKSVISAQLIFDEVYDYWEELPEDERPKLYLHGLSLGAMSSELSPDFYRIVGDPVDGALWVGPPFLSNIWKEVTEKRNPGSSFRLPEFDDGSLVRFRNQFSKSTNQDGWGDMRIIYLQHASDPMTFFSKSLWYKKPEWLKEEKGPEVSSELRWYPIVTFLQIGFDLIVSRGTAPIGFGHDFAPASYIDAWAELTSPVDWSEEKANKLKRLFNP